MKVSTYGLIFAALLYVSSLGGCLGFVNGVGSRKIMGTLQHQSIKSQLFQRSAHPQFKEALVANGLLATAMLKKSESSLTHAGLLHATALGVGLWSFLGVQGWLVCAFYFAFGSLATKVKMIEKEVDRNLLLRYKFLLCGFTFFHCSMLLLRGWASRKSGTELEAQKMSGEALPW